MLGSVPVSAAGANGNAEGAFTTAVDAILGSAGLLALADEGTRAAALGQNAGALGIGAAVINCSR